MTKSFTRSGDCYSLGINHAVDQIEYLDVLPPGVYQLTRDDRHGFYLIASELSSIPDKLYANIRTTANRITRTFMSRQKNTGVLLSGEKGSGKTLLAKLVCQQLASEHAVPTILINNSFVGDDFNEFINSLPQRAVVFFDEFEKVYDDDAQVQLLSLFDGVGHGSCLWLLTANLAWQLNDHMLNRPGRIYYHIAFDGLSEEFVREYCDDKLADMDKLEQLVAAAGAIRRFNFDMLQALVEEVNRYGEEPADAISILNIEGNDSSGIFDVAFTVNGVAPREHTRVVNCSPLNGVPVRIHFSRELQDKPNSEVKAPTVTAWLTAGFGGDQPAVASFQGDSDEEEHETAQSPLEAIVAFRSQSLVRVDEFNGIYEYKQDEYTLTLTRQEAYRYGPRRRSC